MSVTSATSDSSFHGYHPDEGIAINHGSFMAVSGKLHISAGDDLTVAGSGVTAGLTPTWPPDGI